MPWDDKAAAGIKHTTWKRCWKESRGHRVPQKNPNLAGEAGLREEKEPALAPRPMSHLLPGDSGPTRCHCAPRGVGSPVAITQLGLSPATRSCCKPRV